MPDLVLTTGGSNRLLTSGAQPTHLQFGSVTFARQQWSSRSMVAGAFRTVDIQRAIISNQLQMIGVDDDDAQTYANFASLGVWIGNPADGASVLMAFGSAAAGDTYATKELNNDLEVSANVTLNAAQLGNVTFDRAVVLNASERRFGLVRLPTEAEARALAGHAGDRVLTVLRGWEQVLAWHESRKASAQQAKTGTGDDTLMSPLRTKEAIEALSTTPSETALALRQYVPESAVAPVDVTKLTRGAGNWDKPLERGDIVGFQVEVWGSGGSFRKGNPRATGGSYARKFYAWSEMPQRVAYSVGAAIAISTGRESNGNPSRFGTLEAGGGEVGSPYVSGPCMGEDFAEYARIYQTGNVYYPLPAQFAGASTTGTAGSTVGRSIYGGSSFQTANPLIFNGGGAVDASAVSSGRGEVRITTLRG